MGLTIPPIRAEKNPRMTSHSNCATPAKNMTALSQLTRQNSNRFGSAVPSRGCWRQIPLGICDQKRVHPAHFWHTARICGRNSSQTGGTELQHLQFVYRHGLNERSAMSPREAFHSNWLFSGPKND